MYKGRYVCTVTYDFEIDENKNVDGLLPIEDIRSQLASGEAEKVVKSAVEELAFDTDIGKVDVTQNYFDLHECVKDEGGAENA